MALTQEEKKQITREILDQIEASSQGVADLPEATTLEGVHSLPAMRGMDVVSVPLSLLVPEELLAQTTGYDTHTAMSQAAVTEALAGKVDTVAGKGLSTCDFTSAHKEKLEGLHASGLVPAAAAGTLVVEAGRFYYRTGQPSLSVTGVAGFTADADCAALAVSGSCAVTFSSAFTCQQGIDTLEATAAQYKIYTIQRVPLSAIAAIHIVNCSIYG